MNPPDPEHMRREMIGAFVHDMRTPLTSIRMIIDIAKRGSGGPELVLDAELHEMLEGALGELQELANSLQEGSWLERGKMQLKQVPCRLDDVVAEVVRSLEEEVQLETDLEVDLRGEWDRARFVTALGGFVRAVHRCGSGNDTVRSRAWRDGDVCHVRIESGKAGGEARPVNADLGYPFFRGRTIVSAMGGEVGVERAEHYCAIDVTLPMGEA